jgi:kynurenine formamidase
VGGPQRPLTRIVDLSAPIIGSPPGVPVFQRNEIEYFDHASGAAEVEEMFGVPARLLRDGEGWSREVITLGTHNSTHLDAPYHYNSHIAGEPAATIEELPLERFFGPGVVLDFTDRADGDAIDTADVQSALADIPHTLEAGDIVLMRTGRDKFYGQEDYMHHGPGVTAAATRWMYDQGVRVMGIDAWGWDRPLRMQAADALERDEPGIFWEAHQVDLDYSQIERLVHLDQLPPTGFTVACFPLPIARASAAPARVVAIFE